MTLDHLIPGRRVKPHRKHRADDRIAELEARHRTELAELRAENIALHNLKAAADDHFMVMHQLVGDLEGDVRRLLAELAAEQGARAAAEKDVEARDRWLQDSENKLADVERRLHIRTWAEAAAAKTQELDVRGLRERFTTGPVRSLHHAPQASPAHVPAWALVDEGVA